MIDKDRCLLVFWYPSLLIADIYRYRYGSAKPYQSLSIIDPTDLY